MQVKSDDFKLRQLLDAAVDISAKQLKDFLVPTINIYKKWIAELTNLYNVVDDPELTKKVTSIQRQQTLNLKPIARGLAYFEQYGGAHATDTYTKAIGLAPK